MTAHGDVPMSVRAMKAGAVDFLAKPFRAQDMIDAVLVAIGRDRQRRQADGTARAVRDRFATLSAREKQVLMLVTAGMMNKQVAGDLGISEITVKIHRATAMRKMCAKSLVDLVRMADVIRPLTMEPRTIGVTADDRRRPPRASARADGPPQRPAGAASRACR
jgi:FixJ family two-component response regulator